MKKIIVWTLALALLLGIASFAEEIRSNDFGAILRNTYAFCTRGAANAAAWIDHAAENAVNAWNGIMDRSAPAIESMGTWISETAVGAWNSIIGKKAS